MNIGFDAKRAYLNRSGLGNYARNLVRAFVDFYPENNYTCFTPVSESNSFHNYIDAKDNVQIIAPNESMSPAFHSFWRSFLIPINFSKINLDLYHGLSAELPVKVFGKKVKQVVTIHDLIFLRYPNLYPTVDAAIYNKKAKSACKQADVIVAISEQTKRDIVDFYKVPESKIEVVYQCCSPAFYPTHSEEEIESVKNIYKLPKNFMLYVGTVEERKNLLQLIKAVKNSKEFSDFPIVVIGKRKKYFDEVQNFISYNGMTNQVYFFDNVPNHLLPLFYQAASLFVYPSLFEGFGIPIIEAAFSNTPIITSTDSCFEEAGGPDSIYVNPNNTDELSHSIDRVLGDKALADKMVRNTLQYVQKFSDQNTVNHMMNLYKSIS
jgi:glycosyltransferase involved in cell wall biosynthesis